MTIIFQKMQSSSFKYTLSLEKNEKKVSKIKVKLLVDVVDRWFNFFLEMISTYKMFKSAQNF